MMKLSHIYIYVANINTSSGIVNHLLLSAGDVLTVVFTIPRKYPDTRFRVFDQEFLVYSPTLRLHSEFFRIFLDSLEKTESSRLGRYCYDWVTLVDDDGTWSLVCSDALKASASD
jgi:hypothetical protein